MGSSTWPNSNNPAQSRFKLSLLAAYVHKPVPIKHNCSTTTCLSIVNYTMLLCTWSSWCRNGRRRCDWRRRATARESSFSVRPREARTERRAWCAMKPGATPKSATTTTASSSSSISFSPSSGGVPPSKWRVWKELNLLWPRGQLCQAADIKLKRQHLGRQQPRLQKITNLNEVTVWLESAIQIKVAIWTPKKPVSTKQRISLPAQLVVFAKNEKYVADSAVGALAWGAMGASSGSYLVTHEF